MIDAARARGITTIVAGSDATDHPDHVPRPRRRRRHRRRRRGHAGRGARRAERHGAIGATASTRSTGSVLRDARRPQSSGRRRATIIRDLDALPLPAWDLVDVERYRAIWRARHGYFSMNIVDHARLPVPLQLVREADLRPALHRAIAASTSSTEIAWLKRTYQPDHLWIADDIFGLKPGWIERFAALRARARDAAMPFKCLLRADQRDGRRSRARCARAGCRTVWVGAESGSQRILDAMEKGTRVEQIATRGAAAARAPASRSASSCSSAIPARRCDDIERTLQMVRDCAPDDIGMSVSYPLPGTTFYERVQAQLGREAELGRLERPGDDVPRDLSPGLLPGAARAGARRVPRSGARSIALARAGAPSVDCCDRAWRAALVAAPDAGAQASVVSAQGRGAGASGRARRIRRDRRRSSIPMLSPQAAAVPTRAAAVSVMHTATTILVTPRRADEPHVRPAGAGVLSDQPLQQPLRVVRLVEVQRRRRSDAATRSKRVADALPALGTRLVLFSGGEPLLRPEVFEAAAMFRAHGIALHLLTSGVLLERDGGRRGAQSSRA